MEWSDSIPVPATWWQASREENLQETTANQQQTANRMETRNQTMGQEQTTVVGSSLLIS
jgi:hypothetical protein